jgi:hypothetical protein
VPGDARIDHLEPDDLTTNALGLLLAQRVGSDEIRLLPPDDPAEVGLEDRGGLVNVALQACRLESARPSAKAMAAGRTAALGRSMPARRIACAASRDPEPGPPVAGWEMVARTLAVPPANA